MTETWQLVADGGRTMTFPVAGTIESGAIADTTMTATTMTTIPSRD